MKEAAEHARAGNGSVLIEAMTYRRKGHAEHDNQAYVPEGEKEWWAEHNDPIKRYELFLEEKKVMSGTEMESIAAEIRDYLAEESDKAEAEPLPESETAAFGVFDNDVVPPAFRKKVLDR